MARNSHQTDTQTDSTDVVIIGGGVAGVCAALFLAEAGIAAVPAMARLVESKGGTILQGTAVRHESRTPWIVLPRTRALAWYGRNESLAWSAMVARN